jgi:hypothetical protein
MNGITEMGKLLHGQVEENSSLKSQLARVKKEVAFLKSQPTSVSVSSAALNPAVLHCASEIHILINSTLKEALRVRATLDTVKEASMASFEASEAEVVNTSVKESPAPKLHKVSVGTELPMLASLEVPVFHKPESVVAVNLDAPTSRNVMEKLKAMDSPSITTLGIVAHQKLPNSQYVLCKRDNKSSVSKKSKKFEGLQPPITSQLCNSLEQKPSVRINPLFLINYIHV